MDTAYSKCVCGGMDACSTRPFSDFFSSARRWPWLPSSSSSGRNPCEIDFSTLRVLSWHTLEGRRIARVLGVYRERRAGNNMHSCGGTTSWVTSRISSAWAEQGIVVNSHQFVCMADSKGVIESRGTVCIRCDTRIAVVWMALQKRRRTQIR